MSDDIPARAERVRRALQAFLSWLAKGTVDELVDGPPPGLRLPSSLPPENVSGSGVIEPLELPVPAAGDANRGR